jgi:Zn-dependent M28 family amino/carboxypeptidase
MIDKTLIAKEESATCGFQFGIHLNCYYRIGNIVNYYTEFHLLQSDNKRFYLSLYKLIKMKISRIYLTLGVTLFIACSQQHNNHNLISADGLKFHIKNLSSDEFMGRMPFTEGETKTIEYIKKEYEALGLQPGNGDSYYQEVPMVELEAGNMSDLTVSNGSISLELKFKHDFVALTRRVTDHIEINDAELVFAGFGIVAPEYNWNDYEGLDVTGKIVLVLVNDPGFSTGNDSFFKGEEMTYYGRWTYKYEEAARQGAAGILIVHDTKPAAYPWSVVEHGWTGPNLYLKADDNNMSRCETEGWVSLEAAKDIFTLAGKPEYDFTQAAVNQNFKPFSLNLNLSISFDITSKFSKSNNVVGLLPGTSNADEVIIYSAHWDHFGIGDPVDGDSIYNGAIDNASGIAAILEIAKAFDHEQEAPKRSVMFLAVTAEEQGLLGSAYYAAHPIFEPQKTVANINIDALLAIGPMKDLTVIGYGQSELEDIATEFASKQGRYISPDPNPGAGSFFRSDHFNFAKIGIPALYAKGAKEHKTKGIDYATQQREAYTANNYHQPSDEIRDDWDLNGMVEDAVLLFRVGNKLANDPTLWPNWKAGSEFKAIREK